MKNIIFNFVFLFSINFIFSQNYQLDSTFGNAGKITNLSVTGGQVLQMQPDGKIVSCFLSSFSINGNMHLTRFNTNGSLDTSFGVNGFVNSNVVSQIAGATMMKVQIDGKILITGLISSNGSVNSNYLNFCTVRFNSNGTIDNSFGSNGYAITDVQNESSDASYAIEIQIDGKIIIGGSSSNSYLVSTNFSPDFACVRYLSNGLIDNTFGVNGRFVYNFGIQTIPNSGTNSSDFLNSIGIDSTGKIILGGNSTVNQTETDVEKFAFIALNQNGTLDTSFGINGQRVLNFGGKENFSHLKITTDNNIIAIGSHFYLSQGNEYSKIALAKLLSNGNLDATFGLNGMILTNRDATNLNDVVFNFDLQNDGKIIAIGVTTGIIPNQSDFLTIRFNTNGTIDNTFNNVGYFLTDFENADNQGTSIIIQNDGKILCGGLYASNNNGYGCLSRHEPTQLSTSNFDLKNYFNVYPNPFNESINLKFNLNVNSNLKIDLFDSNGRKIYNLIYNKNLQSGSTNLKLDMPKSLSRGIYFLNVSNNNEISTFKIVK